MAALELCANGTHKNQMPTARRSRRKIDPDVAALPKRSHDLYYLFPGHGSRKRYVRNLIWSLIVGILASAAIAGLLYLVYKP
jgi:hypothetical protein